jgi:hypothetical protein
MTKNIVVAMHIVVWCNITETASVVYTPRFTVDNAAAFNREPQTLSSFVQYISTIQDERTTV